MTDPLTARFEALLEPGTPDWLDVHRRVRRRSRRIWLIAAVAAVFLAIPTVAIALDPTILPWTSAKPAPRPVVNDFATFGLGAPPGMDPHVRAGEARAVPLPDGGTVWIAPAANHGICFDFKNSKAGGCDQTRKFPIDVSVGTVGPVPCGEMPSHMILSGHINAQPGSTLQLEFSDGAVSSLRLVFVGPPINAGFFEHRVPGRSHPTALVFRNQSGAAIAKETEMFQNGLYQPQPCPVTLPDGTRVAFLPQGAEAAKARKIISFRATDGSRVYLWLMPHTGGGDCYVTNQGAGCRIARFDKHDPPFLGGLNPAPNRMLIVGQAKPEVATVELRYQNGARERLTPIDGFVLHEITPAHWNRGTRLVAAVALNRNGKAISTDRYQPQQAGVYPCKKPINKGHGAHICP